MSPPEPIVGGATFGCQGAGQRYSQELVNFYCASCRTTNTASQLAPYAEQIRERIVGDLELYRQVCLRTGSEQVP